MCAADLRTPAKSARALKSASLKSYHARIAMPLLIVTGMTGACGKMKRTAFPRGKPSASTTCDQPLPSSPKPCIQMTDASGFGAVSISIAGNSSEVIKVFPPVKLAPPHRSKKSPAGRRMRCNRGSLF